MQIMSGRYAAFDESDAAISADVRQLIASILVVKPDERPTLNALLDAPVLRPYLARHETVRASCTPGNGGIASVEIPLIGYEGSSKTKFSERCAHPMTSPRHYPAAKCWLS